MRVKLERLCVRMRQIGIVTTACVLAIALIALVLGRFSPSQPRLDVLAQLSGHLLGLALSAGVALAIRWRPLFVATLGLFITLATHTLIAEARQAPGPLPAMLDGRPLIRVTALNTWHHNTNLDALLGFLAREQADVVLLSEFGPNKLELLHRLADIYPYRAGCPEVWGCGMLILSRRPFSASGSSAEQGFGPLPHAWARFGAGTNALTVFAVHVIKPIDGALLQRAQLAELAQAVKAAPGHIIVGGDFNATPWSYAFNEFRRQSGLRPVEGLLPSYPAGRKGLPQLAIDHIFVSSALDVVATGLGPETGSDHRPVVAGVTLPAGTPWPKAPPLRDPVIQPLALSKLAPLTP